MDLAHCAWPVGLLSSLKLHAYAVRKAVERLLLTPGPW